MNPEIAAIVIAIGSLLGYIGKRVPFVNNQLIPFLLLAYNYLAALLNGGGFLPDASSASVGLASTTIVTASFVSTWLQPFGIAFVNTAINVFLHQAQKAARRLPWIYKATDTKKKR